jgi:hypothetical protein
MEDRAEVVVSVMLKADGYMSTEEQAINNVKTIIEAHIPQYDPKCSDTSSFKRTVKVSGNALELLARIYHNQPLLDIVAREAIKDLFGDYVPEPED